MDECSLATHNCHPDAACTNIESSFICTCNPGYDGDGITCEGKICFMNILCILNKNMVGSHLDCSHSSYTRILHHSEWCLFVCASPYLSASRLGHPSVYPYFKFCPSVSCPLRNRFIGFLLRLGVAFKSWKSSQIFKLFNSSWASSPLGCVFAGVPLSFSTSCGSDRAFSTTLTIYLVQTTSPDHVPTTCSPGWGATARYKPRRHLICIIVRNFLGTWYKTRSANSAAFLCARLPWSLL